MSDQGYKKDRFPNLLGQMFDCILCQNVVKTPKQCAGCGNLFCKYCIDQYLQKNGSCPNRCNSNSVSNMSARALINIYNQLEIKCVTCFKVQKLADLQRHENICGKAKCKFVDSCAGYQIAGEEFSPFCSEKCHLLNKIIQTNGDQKQIYKFLKEFKPKNAQFQAISGSNVSAMTTSGSNNTGIVELRWSSKECGQNILTTNNHETVCLKEEAYVFRTIVSTNAFMGGRHFWEIHADDRTENQLKIGVSGSNCFDFNTAFCDHRFGFAYYGLGQLRHGSNATGPQYGKRFKKVGALGVFLNMDKGTLHFCLNGEDFGQAYQDNDLKKGPIYAAVALLHCSGCTIKGELPIPSIYAAK